MDADNIIWIIIWGGIIIFSILSSSKEKKQKASNHSQQQYQQQQHRPRVEVMTVPMAPPQAPPPQQKPQPAQQQARASSPAAPSMPEEGQRVTPIRVKTKTVEKPGIDKNPLRQRDNLINALIFGEVLKPKF